MHLNRDVAHLRANIARLAGNDRELAHTLLRNYDEGYVSDKHAGWIGCLAFRTGNYVHGPRAAGVAHIERPAIVGEASPAGDDASQKAGAKGGTKGGTSAPRARKPRNQSTRRRATVH